MGVKYFITLLIASIFLLSGCASSGDKFLSKMSNEEIKAKLIKGKTTKKEVKALFGEPSDVTTLLDGQESWTYQHTKMTMKASSFIPVVGLFHAGADNQTRKLKLLFNKDDILELVSFSDVNVESRTGLIQ